MQVKIFEIESSVVVGMVYMDGIAKTLLNLERLVKLITK